jgi:hypothetical protein
MLGKCNDSNYFIGSNGNILDDYCENNQFNEANTNVLGNYCKLNIFSSGCENNVLGNNCGDNNFGKDCDSNTFGNNCDGNTIGEGCSNNSFGDSCDYLAITKKYIIHYTFSKSVKGDDYNNKLNLDSYLTAGNDYEMKVATNSNGNIVTYCEADLIINN